ncbi:MAG TPA: tetratricopeptide repeat protein [Gemmatimonadaceae bacterium]|nr:tetratricopeptide repeat protein [Gemmatimonadaceae bacterium]
MTAGLPGAGIGGMFYMLSAVGMPFHAAFRVVRAKLGRSADPPKIAWVPILRQFFIAVGILAALWLTGWTIARGINAYPESLGGMRPAARGHQVPNILKRGALILSVGTLSFVLVAVQIARVLIRAPGEGSTARRGALLIALLLLGSSRAVAQTSAASAATHLRAAEAAYSAGESETARAEYSAVLAADPTNSRALYRLGELTRDDPRTSIGLFRRYVAVVPGDAWGHIALADELARDARYGDALKEYDVAFLLAPSERDVVVGRARVLARGGRTDAAIAALESWTSAHPNDAEALRDLGDQRRRAGRFNEAANAYRSAQAIAPLQSTASRLDNVLGNEAPAIEVNSSGSTDSDENRTYRVGGIASMLVSDRARLGVGGGWKSLTGVFSARVADAFVNLYARPTAALRFEAIGGAALTSNNDALLVGAPDKKTIGVGSARAVWKQPGGGGMLDVRATRTLLDASGELVLNQVVRNEVAARVDIPVLSRVKLRGGAKAATYDALNESNTRTSYLAGLAVSPTDAGEVSAIFQEISFDHPTTSGFFAPRLAQLAELGTYFEIESAGGSVLAIDGGAGAQRVAEFGQTSGTWKPAFRLFAQLTVPLRPGSELRAEVDSYNSSFGNEAVSSANWRYVSGLLSLRFALR